MGKKRLLRRNVGIAVVLASLLASGLLAGSAVASPSSPRFLIAEAQCDANVPPLTLQAQLRALPGVEAVDTANVGITGGGPNPGVSQLRAYDVVVAIGDCTWTDDVGMGNNLADYQDAGGVVVGAAYTWANSDGLKGRWITAGYSPYLPGAPSTSSSATLGSFDHASPLMAGVTSLSAYFRSQPALAPGASEIAQWSDGSSAVAVKGAAVGISASLGDYGQTIHWSGDFARIVYNAAPLPSNSFTAALRGRKLRIGVSAPGRVTVSDAAAPLAASGARKKRRLLLKASDASGRPPTIAVRLRLTKLAKATLRRRGKLGLKARITFTPDRGIAATKRIKLRLKAAR